MVKALLLGLLAATMCATAKAAPTPSPEPAMAPAPPPTPPLEDPAARSERSTNLSHVTGAARKIQMFIKNRHLQLLPDGTVNGTTDDTSAYTILQRTTVGIGQMKIQGVATCQYLCMDSCGLLYGSREFGDECIFNETIGQHHYNTYSSSKYSNDRRMLYLALNRRGQPRKVQLRARQQLGRLSSYTRVLTRTVAAEHPMRHHGHLCEGGAKAAASGRAAPEASRCRRRRKRKKKKRRCPHGGAGAEDEECQRGEGRNINNRKQKTGGSSSSSDSSSSVKVKKKGGKKGGKRKAAPTTTPTATPEEDYGTETTTHWEWEDSTAVPDVSMSISTSAQPD